jgi:hypothetical protein
VAFWIGCSDFWRELLIPAREDDDCWNITPKLEEEECHTIKRKRNPTKDTKARMVIRFG